MTAAVVSGATVFFSVIMDASGQARTQSFLLRDELTQRRKTTTCPIMTEYGNDSCNVDVDDQKVCGYEDVYTGGCDGTPITCMPSIECICNGFWDSLWACTIDAVMSTTTTLCHDGNVPIDPYSLRGQRCDPSAA